MNQGLQQSHLGNILIGQLGFLSLNYQLTIRQGGLLLQFLLDTYQQLLIIFILINQNNWPVRYGSILKSGKIKKKLMLPLKLKKKKFYSQKYQIAGKFSKRNYDLAILELQENQFISSNQFLQILFNWNDLKEKILIAGFPTELNKKKKDKDQLLDFELKMYEDMKQISKKHQKFLEYLHCTSKGQSGAPLLSKVGNQYKIIGIHIGISYDQNYKLGIYFSNQTESSYSLLNSFIKQSNAEKLIKPIILGEIEKKSMNQSVNKSQQLISKLQTQNQKLHDEITNLRKQLAKALQEIANLKVKNKSLKKQGFQNTTKLQLINIQNNCQAPLCQSKSQQLNELQNQVNIMRDQIKMLNQFKAKQTQIKFSQYNKLNILFKSVQIVNFSNQQLTDTHLELIEENLTNVQQINLFYCTGVQKINKIKSNKIKKLNLGYTKITDKQIKQIIYELPKLEQLQLKFCDELKKFKINNQKQLKKLNLSNTCIKDVQLEQLVKKLKNLQQLELNFCSHIKVCQITNCKQLKKLGLRSTAITDVQLKQLVKKLPKLEQLDLGSCKLDFYQQITNFKQLKKLSLSNTNIMDAQLQQLVNKLPNLKQLNLYSCKHLANIKITNCRKLKNLNLGQVPIQNAQLEQLVKELPNLEQLRLSVCKQLTQFNITNCKQLKKLSLNNTTISDVQLKFLLEKLPNLEQLELFQCKQLTNFKFIHANKLRIFH